MEAALKKKTLKFLNDLFNKPIVKFFAYASIIVFIFFIYGVFESDGDAAGSIIKKMLGIITSEETLSVFLAGFISVCFAKVVRMCDTYLEESYKVLDNHHTIIDQYSDHKKTAVPNDETFINKEGVFMSLSHLAPFRKSDVKYPVRDKLSKSYFHQQKELELYKNGTLYLPTLNLFSNIKGDTEIVFDDKNELFQLTDFVIENAAALLSAHKHSAKNNNATIRLNDFTYSDSKLTLNTQRSMYYHMLITNRCMDYEVSDGLSIRSVYEYKKYISLLKDSTLSNQIGINGLVLTSDGYVLIEKRDHTKITWKNKFAQSISLALKEGDLKLSGDRVIKNTPEEANSIIKRVIENTIKGNFGLRPEEYSDFNMKDNFLGLARDLLEGGKPNLYFYVTTKYTAEELYKKLLQNARSTDPDSIISRSKLKSDYYLVPFDDLRITYDYSLMLNRKKCYWIYRRISPRSSLLSHMGERIKHTFKTNVHPRFSRECGEALLVTIAYLEQNRHRIDALKK